MTKHDWTVPEVVSQHVHPSTSTCPGLLSEASPGVVTPAVLYVSLPLSQRFAGVLRLVSGLQTVLSVLLLISTSAPTIALRLRPSIGLGGLLC